MKTLIFGGSFDPIHNGHIKLALNAKEILNADKVVFLIAKAPRWKETTATNEDRLNMLKMALKGYKNVEISLIEFNSNDEVNYTYNSLLKYPKKEDEELFFLIGADQVEQLDRWYEIDKLCQLVQIVAYRRPGYKFISEFIDRYHVKAIEVEVSSMSSSSLRGLSSLDAPKCVLDYIVEHNLYYIKDIRKYIKDSRYYHSLSVASTAYDIALANNMNPYDAYLAGLLHDIAKYIPIDEQIEYIKKNIGEEYLSIGEPLYHQFVSVDIAKRVFGVTNEEILDAIAYHATGKANMTKLGKVIYASDKIEPTRGYDSSEMIKACKKDIETGFNLVLEENIKFFNEKGIKYHNLLTDACIKMYLKGE